MPNQLSETWVEDYFRVVDSMDAEALVAFYAPQGRFQFANEQPWQGRDAILAGLQGFYGAISSMQHQKQGFWLGDDGLSAVWEARVTFTQQGGSEFVFPAASILRVQEVGDRIEVLDFRMLMDASPLMAEPAGK